jgi:ABC-2 type transport system ATP-binding protein
LADTADTDRAIAIISAIVGGPAKPHESGLIAPLSDVTRTASVLTALNDQQIALTSLSVAQPTLDEVFLSITGHAATSDTPALQTEGSHK